MPAAARGVPPLAAAPTGADSRAAPRRGRRGPAPPPWCLVRRQVWRTVRCACAWPPSAAAGRWMACGGSWASWVWGGRGEQARVGGPLWPLRDPATRPAGRSAHPSATLQERGDNNPRRRAKLRGRPLLGALSQSTSFSGLRNLIARNQQVPQKIETTHPLHCTPCRLCAPWRGSKSREGSDFFFFLGPKKKKKNLNPLYPFFSKKSVQGVQGVQYPFYHPPSFRDLHPIYPPPPPPCGDVQLHCTPCRLCAPWRGSKSREGPQIF